ncbi:UvrD-helicase domain-containing protein [Acholeplasma granularum]|uniref:UvrD-helicase domain-containing protein n=1 Tax=Acholeplasma granularum TaxID=264635 RepID=UPI00046F5216|nr:UvrD-helicase domain-containing protein [Acholeplasma granularum]
MKYNYTDEQRSAITTHASCFLLLGAAGTGKTHVLVERINYLVKETKLEPNQILILTSTFNEVMNLKDQLDDLMDTSNIAIFTMDSFALKIILDYEGYNKNFISKSIYDEIKLSITKDIIPNLKQFNEYQKRPHIFSNLKINIEEELENYLKENNISLNENFINYAMNLLLNDKDLQKNIINSYSHIFIDRSEDIYGNIKEFIKLITSNTHNLFILGNADQNMHQIDIKETYLYEIYENKDFERISLIDNYKTNNSIIKFSTIINHNLNRIMPEIKYMRLDHYKPDLNIYDDEKTLYDALIKDINEIKLKDNDSNLSDYAIIVPNNTYKDELTKKLKHHFKLPEKDNLIIENHQKIIRLLNERINDTSINDDNFFITILNILDDESIDKRLKDYYTNILSIYMKFTKNFSIKSFIIFLQLKAYEKINIKSDYLISILTLEETKGVDFKYVFTLFLSQMLNEDNELSRRIMYNILFTAQDHIMMYDLKINHHDILEELIYIKNNWNKIKVLKSGYSNIISSTNSYLRPKELDIFEQIKIKYKTYPKLSSELKYLIELIIYFDQKLNMIDTPKNIDIYMQAFRYFIQHTLKVTLDTIFDEQRNKIASYFSGGSAGGFNMDRDYELLIKQKLLDKCFTKNEFKSIHDIYRYLSATHHKNDYVVLNKKELKDASKNIEIYRKLTNRDKVKYFCSVINLYDALNLSDKHLRVIEEKIE